MTENQEAETTKIIVLRVEIETTTNQVIDSTVSHLPNSPPPNLLIPKPTNLPTLAPDHVTDQHHHHPPPPVRT